MPKYPRTVLSIALACGAVALAATAAAANKPDGRAAYERIRSLAGDWSGRMEDPLAGPPVKIRYEVASEGAAVIEHQSADQGFESVIVYFLADGELHATCYSGAGNQPGYELGDDSTDELLLLEFDGGSGLDPKRDGHVHRGEIRFVSPDRIEQRWFHYVGPKEQGATHWFLERVPPEPAPVAAPAAAPVAAPKTPAEPPAAQ